MTSKFFQTESKTPSDENKPFVEGEMSTSMTESMMAAMTDSMMAAVEENQNAEENSNVSNSVVKEMNNTGGSCDSNSVSHQQKNEVINSTVSSNLSKEIKTQELLSESNVYVKESHTVIEDSSVDSLIGGVSSAKLAETHANGDSPPVPMDTTPTRSVDLLGSLNGVHSVNHNGVNNSSAPVIER